MKDLLAGRAIEILAIVPIAVSIVVLEALRAIPRHPDRFADARRGMFVLVVLLAVFLLLVIGGRFYYLHSGT